MCNSRSNRKKTSRFQNSKPKGFGSNSFKTDSSKSYLNYTAKNSIESIQRTLFDNVLSVHMGDGALFFVFLSDDDAIKLKTGGFEEFVEAVKANSVAGEVAR